MSSYSSEKRNAIRRLSEVRESRRMKGQDHKRGVGREETKNNSGGKKLHSFFLRTIYVKGGLTTCRDENKWFYYIPGYVLRGNIVLIVYSQNQIMVCKIMVGGGAISGSFFSLKCGFPLVRKKIPKDINYYSNSTTSKGRHTWYI